MQLESSLCLWTLRFNHVYKDQITKAKTQYKDLENQTKHSMIETISVEEEASRLCIEVEELERERPTQYMKRKASLISFSRTCRIKAAQCIKIVSRGYQKIHHSRRNRQEGICELSWRSWLEDYMFKYSQSNTKVPKLLM